MNAAYLIPALPLAGFLALLVAGRRMRGTTAGWVATSAMAVSFAAALVTFASTLRLTGADRFVTKGIFTWVAAGGFSVKASLLIDPLSVTMALFVTGVGMLIHLYAIGYMEGDERYPTFFVYLNLFAFSMLVLVMADNLLFTFLGWEGVGVCSYFLISFWFERETAAVAGKKAFVTNRVGDVGFLLAMFLAFATFHSLTYFRIFAGVQRAPHSTLVAIGLLLFLGACGKSAQLPLFVWLPDAMEGPTPVSALIHAATMVTAGVYLLVRVSPILELTPGVLTLVAVVGVITALFAATVACAQDDIKRVLAYSTISQLGYMFLAVGSGAYVASIFHMVTHAFFKALLFLGAGAVIHGLHEEQDMKRMGALRRYMPVTAVTFLVGWLAISGIPPFAGFWSKDDILAAAYHKSAPLWALAALTAGLTAYYMSRQVALVFFGSSRWGQGAGGHGGAGHAASGPPHEAPWTMAAPLVVLGALSVVGGAVNLPLRGWEHLERFLAPVVALAHVTETPVATGTKWALFAVTLAVVAVGVSAGLGLWSRRPEHPRLEPVVLEDAWGVDALYSAAFGSGGAFVAAEAAALDSVVIDGTVNGVGTAVRRAGSQLRRLQTGYVRNYALGIAAGAALVLGYVVVRAGG